MRFSWRRTLLTIHLGLPVVFMFVYWEALPNTFAGRLAMLVIGMLIGYIETFIYIPAAPYFSMRGKS